MAWWILVLCCCLLGLTHAFPTHPVGVPASASQSRLFLASKDNEVDRKRAVVIGGGPVGLATALTLSNPPHSYNVVVVEQSSLGVKTYDPTKAYLYNVNPRGQVWTKSYPAVQRRLEERGVGAGRGMGSIVIVPGDPSEPIPPSNVISMDANKDQTKVEQGYWVPRHIMVELLEDVIQDQEKSSKGMDSIGKVELQGSCKFESMEVTEDGLLQVTVQDLAVNHVRYQHTYKANLVVGADGMNSAVRDFLADDTTRPLKTNWLTQHPKKFRLDKWTSPSSGLRMKVLQFPPGFSIPDNDGTLTKTSSETIYALRGINKGPLDYVSLGLLPVKDPNMIRPTNVITRPNHDVWKLRDGPAIRDWFTKAFPRLDFSTLIDETEWDRFAAAQGTTFPKCQCCTGLQVASPTHDNVGVVLVGDALHAFPPDIGQGINAGLADVEALDRALQGRNIVTGKFKNSGAPLPPLNEALQEYERVRSPEVAALVRFSRFGAPYQYRQSWRKDRIGQKLWALNVALRLLLNKLSGGLIPPASIMMAQDKNLTFRQVMRRADLTTAGLMTVLAGILWGVARRCGLKALRL